MSEVSLPIAERFARDGLIVMAPLYAALEIERLATRIGEIAKGQGAPYPRDAIEFEPGGDESSEWSVRKINQCAQHDETFLAHAMDERVLDIVEQLIGPDIKLFGSQCFMKPPGGVEKPYHQDSAYFPIEPTELVTCWTAIDEVTVENGCLAFIPGSHRGEILAHDEPWMVGGRVDMQVGRDSIAWEREMTVELMPGGCSFHHSRLLHRSGPNRTDRPRRGLAVHYMSARSRWTADRPPPKYRLLRGKEYEGCV